MYLLMHLHIKKRGLLNCPAYYREKGWVTKRGDRSGCDDFTAQCNCKRGVTVSTTSFICSAHELVISLRVNYSNVQFFFSFLLLFVFPYLYLRCHSFRVSSCVLFSHSHTPMANKQALVIIPMLLYCTCRVVFFALHRRTVTCTECSVPGRDPQASPVEWSVLTCLIDSRIYQLYL